MVDLGSLHRNLFVYIPSAPGNAIFIVLFALATIAHSF
jgi:hypothetical protein